MPLRNRNLPLVRILLFSFAKFAIAVTPPLPHCTHTIPSTLTTEPVSSWWCGLLGLLGLGLLANPFVVLFWSRRFRGKYCGTRNRSDSSSANASELSAPVPSSSSTESESSVNTTPTQTMTVVAEEAATEVKADVEVEAATTMLHTTPTLITERMEIEAPENNNNKTKKQKWQPPIPQLHLLLDEAEEEEDEEAYVWEPKKMRIRSSIGSNHSHSPNLHRNTTTEISTYDHSSEKATLLQALKWHCQPTFSPITRSTATTPTTTTTALANTTPTRTNTNTSSTAMTAYNTSPPRSTKKRSLASFWNDLPDQYQTDPTFILTCLEQCPHNSMLPSKCAFERKFPNALKVDKDICLAWTRRPDFNALFEQRLLFPPESLTSDKDVMLAYCRQVPRSLQYCYCHHPNHNHEEQEEETTNRIDLTDDFDLVQAAIALHGRELQYASVRLRQDPQLVKQAALNSGGVALEYCSCPTLRHALAANRDFILSIIQQSSSKNANNHNIMDMDNASWWKHISPALLETDQEVLIEALVHGMPMRFCPTSILKLESSIELFESILHRSLAPQTLYFDLPHSLQREFRIAVAALTSASARASASASNNTTGSARSSQTNTTSSSRHNNAALAELCHRVLSRFSSSVSVSITTSSSSTTTTAQTQRAVVLAIAQSGPPDLVEALFYVDHNDTNNNDNDSNMWCDDEEIVVAAFENLNNYHQQRPHLHSHHYSTLDAAAATAGVRTNTTHNHHRLMNLQQHRRRQHHRMRQLQQLAVRQNQNQQPLQPQEQQQPRQPQQPQQQPEQPRSLFFSVSERLRACTRIILAALTSESALEILKSISPILQERHPEIPIQAILIARLEHVPRLVTYIQPGHLWESHRGLAFAWIQRGQSLDIPQLRHLVADRNPPLPVPLVPLRRHLLGPPAAVLAPPVPPTPTPQPPIEYDFCMHVAQYAPLEFGTLIGYNSAHPHTNTNPNVHALTMRHPHWMRDALERNGRVLRFLPLDLQVNPCWRIAAMGTSGVEALEGLHAHAYVRSSQILTLKAYVSNQLQLHQNFVTPFLCAVCLAEETEAEEEENIMNQSGLLRCTSATPTPPCALYKLNCGVETSQAILMRIAEYLDLPTGRHLRDLRRAHQQLHAAEVAEAALTSIRTLTTTTTVTTTTTTTTVGAATRAAPHIDVEMDDDDEEIQVVEEDLDLHLHLGMNDFDLRMDMPTRTLRNPMHRIDQLQQEFEHIHMMEDHLDFMDDPLDFMDDLMIRPLLPMPLYRRRWPPPPDI